MNIASTNPYLADFLRLASPTELLDLKRGGRLEAGLLDRVIAARVDERSLRPRRQQRVAFDPIAAAALVMRTHGRRKSHEQILDESRQRTRRNARRRSAAPPPPRKHWRSE